jgi:hypothetical protein
MSKIQCPCFICGEEATHQNFAGTQLCEKHRERWRPLRDMNDDDRETLSCASPFLGVTFKLP